MGLALFVPGLNLRWFLGRGVCVCVCVCVCLGWPTQSLGQVRLSCTQLGWSYSCCIQAQSTSHSAALLLHGLAAAQPSVTMRPPDTWLGPIPMRHQPSPASPERCLALPTPPDLPPLHLSECQAGQDGTRGLHRLSSACRSSHDLSQGYPVWEVLWEQDLQIPFIPGFCPPSPVPSRPSSGHSLISPSHPGRKMLP
jgi:hypothetical protein